MLVAAQYNSSKLLRRSRSNKSSAVCYKKPIEPLFALAEIIGYCTAIPFYQAGVSWPSPISKSVGEMLYSICDNGYNETEAGAAKATCSVGGIMAGSGVWSDSTGNCTGKLYSGFVSLYRLYFLV